MQILNPDGSRKTLSDDDLKGLENALKAKVMAEAQKKGVYKAEFKGMVKGPDGGVEPAFGSPFDGLSADALDLLSKPPAGNPTAKPIIVLGNEAPVAMTGSEVLKELDKITTPPRKVDVGDIFGF